MAASGLAEHCDLIVVGAGAAGLAAAVRARELGLDTLLLEAKSRIGGRCFTDTESLGLPWDQGAHWMHQALSNPFVEFARERGHGWGEQPREVGHWLAEEGRWASPEEAGDIGSYTDACYRAVEAAGQAGRDISIAEVLPPHDRWRPYAEGWLQALNGCEVEEISTLDYVRYQEDDANWPLQDGYGALLAELHKDTDVLLDTPVEKIDRSGRNIRVRTPRGNFHCRYLIVALSTPILARPHLFEPPLPAEKQRAAAATTARAT